MTVFPVQIEYYIDVAGNMPFWEWQNSLNDLKGKVAVLARLNRARIGNFGDWKSIGHGMGELRIRHGPGYRIYFGRESDNKIIVLCGGTSTRPENIGRIIEAENETEKKKHSS